LAERIWRIERHETVTSTMDLAAERAAAGAHAGTLIVAEEQTSGRGRLGRIWQAPYGTCLLFTALFRPPLRLVQDARLSRLVAERVRAAIATVCGVVADVKEPNDLLIRGRKVAGILCQSSIRGEHVEYLLVGIGVNVNIPADAIPLPTATSLLLETGHLIDRDHLRSAILDELETIPLLTTGATTRIARR
jgi:BirA family biotin operon repressor/biotin-[acetyl-CoA-carboxylase] ligase